MWYTLFFILFIKGIRFINIAEKISSENDIPEHDHRVSDIEVGVRYAIFHNIKQQPDIKVRYNQKDN